MTLLPAVLPWPGRTWALGGASPGVGAGTGAPAAGGPATAAQLNPDSSSGGARQRCRQHSQEQSLPKPRPRPRRRRGARVFSQAHEGPTSAGTQHRARCLWEPAGPAGGSAPRRPTACQCGRRAGVVIAKGSVAPQPLLMRRQLRPAWPAHVWPLGGRPQHLAILRVTPVPRCPPPVTGPASACGPAHEGGGDGA